MVALGETITVYNKSGKVVSTSKHLVNVFKEAQIAYREKKAELKVQREGGASQKPVKDGKLGSRPGTPPRPSYSRSSSRRSERDHRRSGSGSPRSAHAAGDRSYGDGFYAREQSSEPGRLRRNKTMPQLPAETSPQLPRRQSDPDQLAARAARPPSQSSLHDPNIDMDLAYGELPPPLPLRRVDPESELKSKMTMLTRMLEEANCLKYSASAIIKSLEKNPDQMAAVALTLAEISNLAARMAPSALTAMKSSFPAVMALLASPEFAIAIGVGVGLTVVALGGYKIIKKIQGKKTGEKSQVDELEEIEGDLSHIEAWRRGIVMPDNESIITSVEGEFITPGASRRLEEEGLLAPKGSEAEKGRKDKKDKKEKKGSKEEKKRHKRSKSESGSQSSRAVDDIKASRKEPSGLRMLFKKDK